MTASECSICAEAFTTSRRQPVSCCKCGYLACRKCLQRYLSGDESAAACPACRHPYSHKFMFDTFPPGFLGGEYRAKRTRALVKRALGTMDPVIRLAEQERWRRMGRGRSPRAQALRRKERQEPVESEGQVGRCCDERCNGHVSRGACLRCARRVCMSCMAPAHAGGCQESERMSLQTIRDTSKPCPACGLQIEKADGCNEMFCTRCHVMFNWRSMRVRMGPAGHNPEMHDLLFKGAVHAPREVGDLPCGGLPDGVEMDPVLANIRRYVHDMARYEWWRYHISSPSMVDLQIRYLLGDVDEAGLGKALWARTRTRERNVDVRLLLDAFFEQSVTVMREYEEGVQSAEAAVAGMELVRRWFNRELISLCEEHRSAQPVLRSHIPEGWRASGG